MKNYKDTFVNGCNLVYCELPSELKAFEYDFILDHPEYVFVMRDEFKNTKKKLFGNPGAFQILKKDKTIQKNKSTEEIIRLLKALEIYHLADRALHTMSYRQRLSYSLAYDILTTGRDTAFMSDRIFDRELVLCMAKCIRGFNWTNDFKFVWLTGSAHMDEEVLGVCDGLFELKGGELIKRDAKELTEASADVVAPKPSAKEEPAPTVKEPVKEEVPVKEPVEEPVPVKEPVEEPTPVKADIKPKLISKDQLPLPGKVCRLSDGTEAIVLSKQHNPIRLLDGYTFSFRELKSGEVSGLNVMWSRGIENPVYYSYYKTSTSRPGAEAQTMGDFVCYYEQKTKGVEYESYEAELRYCTYLGDGLCKDMLTGETYRPELNSAVKEELSHVEQGDIVSVCLYCGGTYFGGSYRLEKTIALFAFSQKGELNYYNAFNDKYLQTDKVYAEENGKFTDAASEKDELYILHRVTMLEVYNNKLYTDRGVEFPFAWVTPAKGEIKYGLLKGNLNEKTKFKTLSFTPLNEEKSYVVNKSLFDDESVEFLFKKAVLVKAQVFDEEYNLAVPSKTSLERNTLIYTYQDGSNAMCIDMDTSEMLEIPLSDIPNEITEGSVFDYYPEIKYYSLVEEDPADTEAVAESVTTYEGFDPAKQAHIIRIVDGDGRAEEYSYEEGNIEFESEGIEKGMQVKVRFSFDDDTMSLKAHLSL